MDGRCRDCKWWGASPEYVSLHRQHYEFGKEVLSAEQTAGIQAHRSCSNVKVSGDELWHLDSIALSADDPYCTDKLMTGPEFGCIHFEAKQ